MYNDYTAPEVLEVGTVEEVILGIKEFSDPDDGQALPVSEDLDE